MGELKQQIDDFLSLDESFVSVAQYMGILHPLENLTFLAEVVKFNHACYRFGRCGWGLRLQSLFQHQS